MTTAAIVMDRRTATGAAISIGMVRASSGTAISASPKPKSRSNHRGDKNHQQNMQSRTIYHLHDRTHQHERSDKSILALIASMIDGARASVSTIVLFGIGGEASRRTATRRTGFESPSSVDLILMR
jgi:hypothetical protein